MEPTAKDLAFAYHCWRRNFTLQKYDEALTPFLDLPITATLPGLQFARVALMLSSRDVAKRMGVSRQVYAHMEKSEDLRTISLAQLERAAEAMDCELVYAIRPKSRRNFSEILWERVLGEALPRLARRTHLPHMRGHVLAALASEVMRNPRARKKLGLSRQRSRFRVSSR